MPKSTIQAVEEKGAREPQHRANTGDADDTLFMDTLSDLFEGDDVVADNPSMTVVGCVAAMYAAT